jgi:hypothetical protein
VLHSPLLLHGVSPGQLAVSQIVMLRYSSEKLIVINKLLLTTTTTTTTPTVAAPTLM